MRFFNAHCHLELGHLRGAIPAGLPFVEWLRRLVDLKAAGSREDSIAAARAGIARMRDAGCDGVLDILSLDTSEGPLREAGGFRSILFREVIGFWPERAADVLDAAAKRQEAGIAGCEGLSPHAPYTTTEPLLIGAESLARARGQWLCIHAAETAEEDEMIRRGTGPLHEFLARFLPFFWKAPGCSPVAWLDRCGCLGPRTLLAHCNHVSAGDIALMAKRGCSAVVCPGTHEYFARGEFPLRRLLDAGIPTFLGTDSLASNADLDMEREARLACELTPGLSLDAALALADADRGFAHFGMEARA